MSSQLIPTIPPRAKVLVTGGNGFVGSHLAARLSELGCDLYLLLRPTANLENISGIKFQTIIGDLKNPSTMHEILPEIEYVFHSAGLVRARSLAEFISINAEGTTNLLQLVAAHARNLKRFVYISSQAAAGPCGDKILKHETDPATPVSDYGRSKLAGEKEVLRFADRLPVTIIRPSAVFGPRDKDVFTFFKFVRLGWMLKFGSQESFASLVYVKDLVAGIILSAINEAATGETYFINTADEASQWDVQFMMAQLMKVDVRALKIPLGLLNLAGSIGGYIDTRFLGRAPDFGRDKAIELSYRYWLSSSIKARETLGFRPQHSISEALAETYQWYIDNRWL